MRPDPVRTLRTMELFPECVDPEVRAFWEELARRETAQSLSTRTRDLRPSPAKEALALAAEVEIHGAPTEASTTAAAGRC